MKNSKAMKRRKRRRGIFIFEVIVLLILIAGLFVYAQLNGALDKINHVGVDMSEVEVNEGVLDNEVLKGYTTIALVGLDTRPDDTDSTENSDTMIIASINNDTKKVKLVSLYRDTYLNVGDGKYNRANAAYNRGGPTQFMTMLNKNLDLNVSTYVTVDFQAMVEAIDLMGGLEITLTEEEIVHLNNYSVETADVTNKTYDPLPNEEGTYLLNGVQCVSYARIRYTAGNDFKRASRQRLVIYKMVEKAKSADLSTLTKMMDQIFPMITTGLTKAEIIKMGVSMLSYDIEDQAGFPFHHLYGKTIEDIMGIDCVLPITLEYNVKELHQFLYSGEDYIPSATVKEYSDYIIEKSGYGEDRIPSESEDGALPIENF